MTITGTASRSTRPPAHHLPFAMVLAGGGARGLCHAGVLRALEHYGCRPNAVVGVSMGAVVAVTYALNPNWYSALVDLDIDGFPFPARPSEPDFLARLRALAAAERMLQDMVFGWGVGARSLGWGRSLLDQLTRGKALEDGRVGVATVATDLRSGRRVVLDHGNAAEAAHASAALAGIVPPVVRGRHMLADGAYTDLAPIDVARRWGDTVVIAVDAYQPHDRRPPSNGVQAMLRAMEICAREHARLRLRQADFVLRPEFSIPIDTLDFRHKRIAVAAGLRVVRRSLRQLREILQPG